MTTRGLVCTALLLASTQAAAATIILRPGETREFGQDLAFCTQGDPVLDASYPDSLTGRTWTWLGAASHTHARDMCAQIGYTLPTAADFLAVRQRIADSALGDRMRAQGTVAWVADTATAVVIIATGGYSGNFAATSGNVICFKTTEAE